MFLDSIWKPALLDLVLLQSKKTTWSIFAIVKDQQHDFGSGASFQPAGGVLACRYDSLLQIKSFPLTLDLGDLMAPFFIGFQIRKSYYPGKCFSRCKTRDQQEIRYLQVLVCHIWTRLVEGPAFLPITRPHRILPLW